MSEVLAKDTILSYIGSEIESKASSVSIRAINERGREAVEKTAFPTKKDEDWRFINLKSITKNSFVSVNDAGVKDAGDISGHYLPEALNTRLVFVNGVYNETLSSVDGLPKGVIVGNLSEYADHETVKEYLGTITNYEDDVFAPFNDAVFSDGTFIYVPEETTVEAPIHILNVFTDAEKPFFATPRLLFVGEMYSKATIIEEHIGLSNNAYLNVPVTEFKLFSGAHVHHARIQRDSKTASHVSRPIAMLDGHAEYHSYTICLGAKLFRNDPRVIQNAEEVDFTVDGLVLIDGEQIADTHSIMDHRFAHGRSHQLHKCVINDEAHSIFNGKIFVAKDAQKIDSFQENRNLLLSDDGKVNTKPQLEIFADDVLCSHGATIGQLSDEEVFYLHSRGLTEQKSRELLVYAFALESVESMEVESVEKLLLDEVIKYTTRD
ncbi:MAG TPA: Fe-S cluster assembly protein SufD [Balneolaceae bacterium]|nr:Fe-S cluster assembly protein SufD [Balneolaceae bacterium]|tara:strand:+ start:142963 stop:144267 length:1305 start_codon:yes stop_codon:yes gene_type:complete